MSLPWKGSFGEQMSTAWCCRVCLLIVHNAVGLGLFLGGGWAEVTTGRVPALQDSPFLKNQAQKCPCHPGEALGQQAYEWSLVPGASHTHL